MSNYVKLTDYASKDALTTGNPLKLIKGTEINDDLNAIQTAVATKADLSSPDFLGNPTAPTQTTGNSTTRLANTAFVQQELDAAQAAVAITGGTIAGVAITGGTVTGLATDLAVADGGTGASTLAANAVLLGNGTSTLQTVAPSTTGNILTSNGTTWQSSAAPIGIEPSTGNAPYLAARAWVSFNGTTTPPTITASKNVSSVNRLSTGSFEIIFTIALPSDDYAVIGSANNNGSTFAHFINTTSTSSTKCSISSVAVTSSASNPTDCSIVCFA